METIETVEGPQSHLTDEKTVSEQKPKTASENEVEEEVIEDEPIGSEEVVKSEKPHED